MRGGFLLPQGGSKAPPAPRDSVINITDVTEPSDKAGPAGKLPVTAAAHTAAPAATPEQVEAGLAECLDLLRGPTDERRFVGLLLVTKLLPAGDAATITRVHDTVGSNFLDRLLLPLRTTSQAVVPGPMPPEQAAAQQQQEAAQCGLGLAVLSSFARVPELAASEDMVGRLPLLLNVVRAGGISPLVAARWNGGVPSGSGATQSQAQTAANADPLADSIALQDALECAVAVARSGTEGRAVAVESGAVAAAAAVLQLCPPEASQQLSLALQLLAALADHEGRWQVMAGGRGAALEQLLPALACAFALPAEHAAASSSKGSQDERLQRQRQLLAVQLEALHVLLLLLPLPHAAHPPMQLLLPGARWPQQLRRGLALLLRGRVSAVQRHSALQLAAAVADLLGLEWLLGGPGPLPRAGKSGRKDGDRAGGGGGGSQAGDRAEEVQGFFQLLVEVVKVETSVLLHDALAPGIPVPLASAASTAAADWRPPPPKAHQLAAEYGGSAAGSDAGDSLPDAAGAELAADLAGGQQAGEDVSADVEPLVRVLHSEADRRQMEQELQREQEAAAAAGAGPAPHPRQQQQGDHMRRVDETAIPTEMRWEGPSEASGARAARVLPCCFALLEAGVEALAIDTQRCEAMEVEGSSSTSQPPAVLSAAVAHRALFSLQEAVEVVLQYIEQMSCEVAGKSGGDGAAARQPLLLAALRVLARFCAEVPDAFAARVRPLLPFLLSLRAGEEQPAGQAEGGQDRHLPVPAEGATFLLPLLLQVTDPHYGASSGERQPGEERQLWLDALCQPTAVQQLVQYTRECAASCVPAVTAAAAAAADDALIYACQLMLNLVANDAGPQHQKAATAAGRQRQRRRRRQLLAADGTLSLLRVLLQLAGLRPVASPADCTPDELVHAARLFTTVATLSAALAGSIAAEMNNNEVEGGHSGDTISVSDSRIGTAEADMKQLQLGLSMEENSKQVEEDQWEEGLSGRGKESLGAPGEQPAPQHLPCLGPLSGRLMSALCSQLLAAIQAAVQLTCSQAHLAQLMPVEAGAGSSAGCSAAGTTAGSGASSATARLAAARSAVAADEALHLELLRILGAAASAAAVLVGGYKPFAAMCNQHSLVVAELALSRRQEPRAAVTGAPSGPATGSAEELAAFKVFLRSVTEARL